MPEFTDTRKIPFDGPVDEAFVKHTRGPKPASRSYGSTTRFDDTVHNTWLELRGADQNAPRDQSALGTSRSLGAEGTLTDWLCACAARMSKAVCTALATAQIDLARLNRDDQPTLGLDVHAIVATIRHESHILVSVSSELRKSRSKVFASSLFAPSGAYLAWLKAYSRTPERRRKQAARNAAYWAIKAGLLPEKDRCERCGAVAGRARLNRHHPDYRDPLRIVWLCTVCHGAAHRKYPPREV